MAVSLFQFEKNIKATGYPAHNLSLATGILSAKSAGSDVVGYNVEYRDYVSDLTNRTQVLGARLSKKLTFDPSSDAMRNAGVEHAWKYEQASVKMGGRGSSRWNAKEREEILKSGKVEGAEGHHIESVADCPEKQVDPNNIKIYRNHEEHLKKGHGGNTQKTIKQKTIDKTNMLKRNNAIRVAKRELQGIATTAAIAFGIGFSIEMISTLAREGISTDSVKTALKNGLMTGLRSSVVAIGSYVVSRFVVIGMEKLLGISATWAKEVSPFVVSALFALGEVFLLKKMGYSTKEAIKRAAIGFAIRGAIAGLKFIPYCGKYLALAACIIYTGAEIAIGVKAVKFYRELEDKTVVWMLPKFA